MEVYVCIQTDGLQRAQTDEVGGRDFHILAKEKEKSRSRRGSGREEVKKDEER